MDISTLFSDHIIEALGWTIVHSIWQASLIGLMLFLLLPLLQNRAAQTRYHLTFGSLMLIFATSLSTFLYYLQTSPVLIASNPLIASSPPYQTDITHFVYSSSLLNFLQENLDIISGFWIIGMILYFLKFGIGYYRIRRFKDQIIIQESHPINSLFNNVAKQFNLNRKISLNLTKNFAGPFVSGWLKPIVYFPFSLACQLTEDQLEDIIAHEISHIVRNDFLMNLIQIFVENLFYYHPAIWWIGATIRKERELACDELALQISGTTRIRYAGSLLSLGKYTLYKSPKLGLSAKGNKSDLFSRISNLLGEKQKNNQVREKIIISTIIIGIMGVILSFRSPMEKHISSDLPKQIEILKLNDTLSNYEQVLETIQITEWSENDLVFNELDKFEILPEYKEVVKTSEKGNEKSHKKRINKAELILIESVNKLQHQKDSIFIDHLEWIETSELDSKEVEIFSNTKIQFQYFQSDSLLPDRLIRENEWSNTSKESNNFSKVKYLIGRELFDQSKIELNDKFFVFMDTISDLETDESKIKIELTTEITGNHNKWSEEAKDLKFIIRNIENNHELNIDESSSRIQIKNELSRPIQVKSLQLKNLINNDFEDFVLKEMEKEGLLKENEINIIVSEKAMKINGTIVDDSYYLKYENQMSNSSAMNHENGVKKNINQSNTNLLK